MDDELRQLLDLLEAAVPADSNRLGDAKGNRLVEIAQEIAQLPVPQAPLSEEDFLKIERAVRIEAERIGVPHFPPPWAVFAATFLVVLVLVISVIFLLSENEDKSDRLTTPDMAETISPTESPTMIVTISPVPSATLTATQESTAVPTAQVIPSATAPTLETDLPVTLVIEGSVEAINVNVIRVYGIEIELTPDDLAELRVGDMVRIEAAVSEDNIFIAITMEVIQPTSPNNNRGSGGEEIPSGGENEDGADDDDD